MDSAAWATPLALLPGVALLILSTVTRFNHARDDCRRRLEKGRSPYLAAVEFRLRRMRDALTAFYAAVVVLSLASVAAATIPRLFVDERLTVEALTAAGAACVIYGAIHLLIEVRSSLHDVGE